MIIPQKMKIEEWRRKNLLDIVFEKGLSLGAMPATYYFNHIYAPIRTPTASGMPDSYTYVDVGLTYSQIADIYAARFGGNYWPQWFADSAALNEAISNYNCMAVDRIIATLEEHGLKYKKLIETGGFIWNPLWNVDGEELHSTIEQHADETTETGTDITDTRSVQPFDSSTWKNAEKNQRSGTAANNKQTKKHTQDAHSVSADMNAFAEALSAGDRYFVERTVRRGNIGVTQTVDLLENSIKYFRWNIIDEFFKDLNRILLIGIF